MQIYGDFYVGDNLKLGRAKIKRRIQRNRSGKDWFYISLSTMKDGMLEIIPAALTRYSWYPSKDLQIVGVEKGYYHALLLVKQMTSDVFEATGDCKLKEYFLSRMERSKE